MKMSKIIGKVIGKVINALIKEKTLALLILSGNPLLGILWAIGVIIMTT